MNYEVETTDIFDNWLENLNDKSIVLRIMARVPRIKAGNFGDFKKIENNLFELRFFFGSGFRVYYCTRGDGVILLLNGGDKSSQNKDIRKAKLILASLE